MNESIESWYSFGSRLRPVEQTQAGTASVFAAFSLSIYPSEPEDSSRGANVAGAILEAGPRRGESKRPKRRHRKVKPASAPPARPFPPAPHRHPLKSPTPNRRGR